ncbi:glycosyltransferase family 4 protein [Ancylobacter terrae]|uniref:glycosyltransferase family 4 protein n=1 Tax=Ancylobacter sp. sgz301288 TaxID=3342077 RepID=UPI00385A7104
MKIALVSHIPLFPTGQGHRRRILTIIRSLRALGHDVHFILLRSRDSDDADMARHEEELGAANISVIERTLLADFPGRLLRNLPHIARRLAMKVNRKVRQRLGVPGGYYNLLDEWYFPDFTPALAALHERFRFEAVMVEYIFFSRAFEAFPASTLRILDTHDSFADRHLSFGESANRGMYWFSVPPSEQIRAFRRADVVIAIQEEEAENFARALGSPPPAVTTVSYAPETTARVADYAPSGAVFIGSRSQQNEEAMAYFITSVMPLVIRELPDFRLDVVGRVCEVVPDHPNIRKRGFVAEVIDAYREAPLAINPMRTGTGINIKLIDAMACGVFTLTTRTGARGLGSAFLGGVELVDDDDPAAFAERLVVYLRSEAERRDGGLRALASIEAWNRLQIDRLAELLANPANGATRTTPTIKPDR